MVKIYEYAKKLKISETLTKKLLKIFNWSPKKKIVVFFLNHLIDVNFHSGPRTIFKDNYTWTKFLLNKITN